jgi:type IV pilus assembly protein PilF
VSIIFRMHIGGIAALILASCVSTTSGPPEPEPDKAAAAIQYYQLGARYYKAGNYDLARDRLERALSFDPKMAIAHSVLALTYQELDVPRLAKQHFEQAVQFEPRNIDARNTYAVFLCQQREFDDAREQFERAIKIPENDDPELMMTNAGVCSVQEPNLVEAEKYFRRALTEKPNYAEALLQMALLTRETGDSLSARAFLQRFLASNPPSAAILYLAVQIENDNGDRRASTDYSDQLLRDFPSSAEAKSLMEAG